jgi:hypothetical protein
VCRYVKGGWRVERLTSASSLVDQRHLVDPPIASNAMNLRAFRLSAEKRRLLSQPKFSSRQQLSTTPNLKRISAKFYGTYLIKTYSTLNLVIIYVGSIRLNGNEWRD